jgi:hypothetical protein
MEGGPAALAGCAAGMELLAVAGGGSHGGGFASDFDANGALLGGGDPATRLGLAAMQVI